MIYFVLLLVNAAMAIQCLLALVLEPTASNAALVLASILICSLLVTLIGRELSEWISGRTP